MTVSLKKGWMELPEECFQTLKFGELKVGDKFISLPLPGDNHGHGGFRISHHVFIKNIECVTETISGLEYHPSIQHGRATNMANGNSSDFPHSMPVILLELISQSSLVLPQS